MKLTAQEHLKMITQAKRKAPTILSNVCCYILRYGGWRLTSGAQKFLSDVPNRSGKSRMKLSLLSTFEHWWLLFLELPTISLSDSPSILRMYVSGHMDLFSHIQSYLAEERKWLEHWVYERKVSWKYTLLTLNFLQGWLIRIAWLSRVEHHGFRAPLQFILNYL